MDSFRFNNPWDNTSSFKKALTLISFFTSILVPLYILQLVFWISALIFLAYVVLKGFLGDILLIVLWVWSGIVVFSNPIDVITIVYIVAGLAELYFFTIPFFKTIGFTVKLSKGNSSYYEKKALEMGVDIETAKRIDQIERENERIKREREMTIEQQKGQAYIAKFDGLAKDSQRKRTGLWTMVVVSIVGVLSIAFFSGIFTYNERYEKYLEAKLEDRSLYVKIDIEEEMTSYNNLGTNIEIVHTCNNKVVSSGDKIQAGKLMRFVTFITEHDAIPDEGRGSANFNLPPLEQSKFVNIRVQEEGGQRYSDAYAIWQITYTIEPVVSLGDKVSAFFYFE